MNWIARTIGTVFTVGGYAALVVFMLWGSLLTLVLVTGFAGFWGLVLGVTLLPVTFTVAPLYAGIKLGYWFPAIICYVAPIGSGLMIACGQYLKEWSERDEIPAWMLAVDEEVEECKELSQ